MKCWAPPTHTSEIHTVALGYVDIGDDDARRDDGADEAAVAAIAAKPTWSVHDRRTTGFFRLTHR
jgi:hypothetical protein